MYCTLIKSPSGGEQLVAAPYNAKQAFVWDVATGSLVSKFKMLENAYLTDMTRDPFNAGAFLIVAHSKIHIYDVRSKGEQRSIVSAGDCRNLRFPAGANGKLISHSSDYANVVDYNTGKRMHKIYGGDDKKGNFHGLAISRNAVAAFVDCRDNVGYYFWDLSTLM